MLNDRFWTKVDKSDPNGCWVWMANRNNKGYGLFRPGGTAPKRLAHRLSYENAKGPIPKGLFVLHSCDNPGCVNPDHLRIGNAKQNVADMDSRNRRVFSPKYGSQNATAILSDAEVIGIRRAYVSGVTTKEIAARFGVSINSIGDYCCGRSWRHLFDDPACPTLESLNAAAAQRRRTGAKLCPDDVREIRKRIANGETAKSIASDFGVDPRNIRDIRRGKIWYSVS